MSFADNLLLLKIHKGTLGTLLVFFLVYLILYFPPNFSSHF